MNVRQQLSSIGLSVESWQEVLAQGVAPASPTQSPEKNQPTVWVGFSGGLDSCVLLSLLQAFFREYSPSQAACHFPWRLAALHVNHQLQDQADYWAKWCGQFCAERDVPLFVETVSIDPVRAANQGVEAAARHARYAAFRARVRQGDLLLLAHHADDQLETVLLRWLRGAGIDGLGGMSSMSQQEQLSVWRPLLAVSRQQLEQLGADLAVSWQEDPSNQDVRFDRNFLRHRVIPAIKSRWPQVIKTVLRTSQQTRCASEDLTAFVDRVIDHSIGGVGASAEVLPLSVMSGFSLSAQATLLRRWLIRAGCADLSARQIDEILSSVVGARGDAQPEFCYKSWRLRRHAGALYLSRVSPEANLAVTNAYGLVQIPISDPVLWDPSLQPRLRWLGGEILCLAPESISAILLAMHDTTDTELEVLAREQVEAGELPKRLKQRFQAQKVPVWLRAGWPVLRCQDGHICLPGLWMSQPLKEAVERVLDDNSPIALGLFQWRPPESL